MKEKIKVIFSLLICISILFTFFAVNIQATSTTITSNQAGIHEGYNYEYLKDSGNGTMTLKDGGTFNCEWDNINKISFRKGFKYRTPIRYQETQNINMKYACNYQPNGDSYLSIYGWASDPLIEFYIVENWGTVKPQKNKIPKDIVTLNGSTYEIFEDTITKPSTDSYMTYKQYWSVRTTKRTSGTVSISEIFKAMEANGMEIGNINEISLCVQGNKSSGKAYVTQMSFFGPPPSDLVTPTPSASITLLGDVDEDGIVNSIDFAMYRQYLLGIRSSLPATGDINKNGTLNSIDFAILRQYLLGKIVLVPSDTPVPSTPTPSP